MALKNIPPSTLYRHITVITRSLSALAAIQQPRQQSGQSIIQQIYELHLGFPPAAPLPVGPSPCRPLGASHAAAQGDGPPEAFAALNLMTEPTPASKEARTARNSAC